MSSKPLYNHFEKQTTMYSIGLITTVAIDTFTNPSVYPFALF